MAAASENVTQRTQQNMTFWTKTATRKKKRKKEREKKKERRKSASTMKDRDIKQTIKHDSKNVDGVIGMYIHFNVE